MYSEAHAHEHRDLIRRLAVISKKYAESDKTKGMDKISDEVVSLLKDWLVDHIIQSDLRMKPYVKKMRETGLKMVPLKEPIAFDNDNLINLDAQTAITVRVRHKEQGRASAMSWVRTKNPGLSAEQAGAVVDRIIACQPGNAIVNKTQNSAKAKE